MASGGKLSPIVKLLNNPTAPPMAAMMNRALSVREGLNVRVLTCSENDLRR